MGHVISFMIGAFVGMVLMGCAVIASRDYYDE